MPEQKEGQESEDKHASTILKEDNDNNETEGRQSMVENKEENFVADDA